MSVTTAKNRISYTGDGQTTVFAFPYLFQNNEDIEVWINNVQVTTGFETTGASNASLPTVGGQVDFGTAPGVGQTVTLIRNPSTEQNTVLAPNDAFPAKTIETMVDAAMLAIQRVYDILGLQPTQNQLPTALSYPFQESGLSGTLPVAATRALSVLGFDANGLPTVLPLPAAVGAGNMTVELGKGGTPGFKNGVDFTAGTTTTLTLSQSYGSVANVTVAWDVDYIEKDSYILSGNQLTFGSWSGGTFTPSPIPNGVSNVDVVGGTSLSLNIPAAGSVGAAQIQPNSVGDVQLAWGNVLKRVVGSVALLAALNTSIYTHAFATGFSGDGAPGGGDYVYSASTPQSSAVPGVIVPSTFPGATGCWLLKYNGRIEAEQFGAYNNGTNIATNNTVFAAIVAWLNTLAVKPEIAFSGTYAYSVSPNWAIQNAVFRGYGETHFQYSGTGDVVTLDGSGAPNLGVYNMTMEGFTVDGASTSQNGVNVGYCHHGRFRFKVRGCGAAYSGIKTSFCVLSDFEDCEVSPNADGGWYLGNVPLYGFHVTGPSAVLQTSYCNFRNAIAEGCTTTNGAGIFIECALGNNFYGGSAEGCATGILTANPTNGCANNKFFGMDMESNVTQDIYDQGFQNEYHSCDTSLLVNIIGNSVRAQFFGGQHQSISIASGASYPGFFGVVYNRAGSGTFSDGSGTARVRDCFDHSNNKPGPFTQTSVTAGASPWTYTNTKGRETQLVVSVGGGTVSQLERLRAGVGTLLPITTGEFSVSPGDQLEFTYTGTLSVWEYTT